MRSLTRVPAMRARAEGLMLDTGTAARPTGGHAYNPATQSEDLATADLFTSRCKIQARDVAPREAEVGGRTTVTIRLELHLPATTAPLRAGDLWTMTAVSGLSLAEDGAQYRVTAPVDGTLKTARRYEVERA